MSIGPSAARVIADHYIFCGNGKHENPDLAAVTLLLDTNRELRPNAAYKLWFNSRPGSGAGRCSEQSHEGPRSTRFRAVRPQATERSGFRSSKSRGLSWRSNHGRRSGRMA